MGFKKSILRVFSANFLSVISGIFISFIISLFRYVNVIGDKLSKKDKAPETASGVDNAIAQIVSSEENEADDLELVAVITAAIAASEGTSSDGLVVRSIRKRR